MLKMKFSSSPGMYVPALNPCVLVETGEKQIIDGKLTEVRQTTTRVKAK